MTCSKAAEAGTNYDRGTFELELSPDQVIYIYAQDQGGQTFNCTNEATPDAVPLRAIRAEFSLSNDATMVAGSLTGCMLETEADSLCSCLGQCPTLMNPNAECDCNPNATKLTTLLTGVNPSQNCSDLMGEPAFDMQVGFTASKLAMQPGVCG
jgi:hypothetical protein